MSLLRKNDNRIRIDAMKNIVVGIDVGGSTTKIVGYRRQHEDDIIRCT